MKNLFYSKIFFSNIDVKRAAVTSNILLKHNIIVKLCYSCKVVLECKKIITPFTYGRGNSRHFG